MTHSKIFIIGLVLAFISGVSLVSIIPIQFNIVFADVYSLYNSSPPILPDNMTSISYQTCDIFSGCHTVTDQITDDQRHSHFDDWCYSIQNHYQTGKMVQYFRTMSHDCVSWIIDQKLQPLNAKLDNLTAEIHDLKARLK